jgi:thioredoxin reductase (NADPH)
VKFQFISHNSKPTRSEALEYYRRVASHWNLKLNLYEEINTIDVKAGGYEIRSSKKNL